MGQRLAVALVAGCVASSFALSWAFAGPPDEKRASYVLASRPHERSGAVGRLAREARSLLAPVIGDAPALRIEVVSDADFADLAARAGELDATAFVAFERRSVVALDREVDEARARLLVHEAAKLHVALVRGERAAPWLEEGLACCVEDAWAQGVDLGFERPDSDRLARARFEVRRGVPLERVRALPVAAFERGERVHRDVALAWAATHRLIRRGELDRALSEH